MRLGESKSKVDSRRERRECKGGRASRVSPGLKPFSGLGGLPSLLLHHGVVRSCLFQFIRQVRLRAAGFRQSYRVESCQPAFLLTPLRYHQAIKSYPCIKLERIGLPDDPKECLRARCYVFHYSRGIVPRSARVIRIDHDHQIL